MTLHIQFTPDGRHIRRWSREPFDGGEAYVAASDLAETARNLRRYPFESATMAEAGRLAADELERAVRRA